MEGVEAASDNGDEDGYDAIVVGSGYGGSVAACRMSMAGINVCLVEKGRRWESQDFPTDTIKMVSAARIENHNLGITIGPQDALFQVYQQGDSLAAVACGLGGGSLVNAGVMIPTPVRAKRNPKWPREWERDWESFEASASAMLRVQDVPVKFASAKIMEDIVGEEEFEETHRGSLKLSVNFGREEGFSPSVQSREKNSCLACGNCLSGCPYNAKTSTDKTYLASAVQAGCNIKTECQVQYVVENSDYISKRNDELKGKKGARRWLVFLNEIDYLSSDYVILSAGVFGTSKILFQSQMRGLKLSERVGSGFSCNGNNVAYLAGSPAPLNAYGLDQKSFSKVAFEERPGPSISSSYTSSLGFTIQSAVLPTPYPYLLFKGITTYGLPSCFWFLHGVIDKLKCMLGIKSSKAMILNAMGYDESDGDITFDNDTNTLHFRPPRDLLLPRKIEAFQKLAKKLGGILFMARYRSASVHLLGGCNASSDSSKGVCNPKGQVFDGKSHNSVHNGLYVCDASLIPCSIGVNPSLTITTLAEHVSKHLVEDIPRQNLKEGTLSKNKSENPKPGSITSLKMKNSSESMVVFTETMRGFVGGMNCTAYLKLHMNYRAMKKGEENIAFPEKSHPLLSGKVSGHVVCIALEIGKLHVIDGEVNLCEVDKKTPYTQYMHYRLLLAASSGSRYILEGKKVLNPYLGCLYAWRETTELHITLRKVLADTSKEEVQNLKGKLSISFLELLKSLISLKGQMRVRFIRLLLHSLFRTYISQVPRGIHQDFSTLTSWKRLYPTDTLHEIQTEDGFMISCRLWKCKRDMLTVEGKEEIKSPVLLINGYSTECYSLPTEENDLVRTLLNEGHETWLLQPRLHPSKSSNSFTIDDIGRFDIPAAMERICHLHGPSAKVHIVAHCVGGLAVHIALMGGFVSASRVASLSCTNSSMFFKLTASSRFKMWLPLIPISMTILGKNKILPLLKTSKASSRHRLLRYVARFIPRCERCTCDECEVFSGIFGNTFWHNNVSSSMHYWLNEESLPHLPMAAFPHLSKICNAGFIVDSKGNSSYLMHPERMALATLYISGERSLLVTPRTSFLAHNYMKLHQPGFRHERVVVEGFGHSDLLIGEESSLKVFPHIISHIKLAESGNVLAVAGKRSKFKKEALSWGDDPFEERNGWLLSWSFSLLAFLVLLVLLGMLALI